MGVESRLPARTELGQSRAALPNDYGESLAPGARNPAHYEAAAGALRGRQHKEDACPTRSPFQRDRDRVLHSTAFRRLTHKTQVFIYHEGDHYRSRLTHSLEVAQIARTIARQLRLNEDLAECLSLAHDLGHPPFGHAGERALDAVMHDHGGFDHNAQSLRIVLSLERKYAAFLGLNLTWEVLEGLAKHNGPVHGTASPIHKVTRELAHWKSLELDSWASAEAQVASLADDIAYLTHDIDDGLRAELLSVATLKNVPLLDTIVADLTSRSDSAPAQMPYEISRRMITALIADVVGESRRRLKALAPDGPDAIRTAETGVIAFSKEFQSIISEVRAFLFARVYRSDRVMVVMRHAEDIVKDLFAHYRAPEGRADLPVDWRRAGENLSGGQATRLIADYLAGMTDRFAYAEHQRLFDATPELR